MAHQQLPLNSLVVRGNNNHHSTATTSNDNNFQVDNQKITFTELDNVSQICCHESNFHECSPSQYQEYMNGRLDRQLSTSAELATSVSGSLPPITSFGSHKSAMVQPENIGSLMEPSTSVSPLSCLTLSTSYGQRNNHLPNTNTKVQSEPQWKKSATTLNNSIHIIQHHHQQQQFNSRLSDVGLENNFQQKQMSSPAYSIQQPNSISNPASIMSATPDSPSSSIRPPSVRSNYSIRFVNSTPDSTAIINNTNEHISLSDKIINQLQDGEVHRFIGETSNNFYNERQKETKSSNSQSAENLKNAKRTYANRGQMQKIKTSTPLLPQFESSSNISNLSYSGDGLTVREHLQQQQAVQKKRLQQELIYKRLRKEDTQIGMNNNTEKSKFQIESAPPSVALDTVVSSSSVSSSPTINSNNIKNKSQKINILTTTPVHQLLKAESLSPPKRNTTNRSRTGVQTQKKIAASITTPSLASSSEALASTIASVASGGGTLDEFEKFSSTSNSVVSTSTLNCSPSTSVLSHSVSPHRLTSPKIAETNFTTKSNPPIKRRKTLSSHLSATNAKKGPNSILSVEKPFELPVSIAPFFQQIRNSSPSKHVQKQQHCRIHVQNPPQTHEDFPISGTKIQVVHMQPSPTSATISTNVSPKTESFLPSKQSNDNIISQPEQQSPFSAPLSAASSEMMIHDVGNMLYSPKGGVVTPLMAGHSPVSPFHAAPPQPRQSLLTSISHKSGTPSELRHQHQRTENTLFHKQFKFMSSESQEESTSLAAISCQQQQQISHQYANQQNATIVKYSLPLRHQQQPLASGIAYGQDNGTSPSPHQHIPYSPLNIGTLAPPPAQFQQMDFLQLSRYQQQHPRSHLQLQQSEFGSPTHPEVQQLNQHQLMPSVTSMRYPYPQQQQQDLIMEQQPNQANSSTEQQQIPYQQQLLQRSKFVQEQQKQQLHPKLCSSPIIRYNSGIVLAQQQQLVSPLSTKLYSSKQLHEEQQQQQQRAGCCSPMHNSTHPYQKTVQQMQTSASIQTSNFLTQSSSQLSGPIPYPQNIIDSELQSQQQPAPPPQRAQLSRAHLLARHEQEKYAVKLYHLQHTVKALVYKNGALADELARLNQRIHVVTEERRMLAKRLQHHERNKIRRLQAQFRKTIAAAALTVKDETPDKSMDELNQVIINRELEIGMDSKQNQEFKLTQTANIKNCIEDEFITTTTSNSTTTCTSEIRVETKREPADSPLMEKAIDHNEVFCEEKSLLVNS